MIVIACNGDDEVDIVVVGGSGRSLWLDGIEGKCGQGVEVRACARVFVISLTAIHSIVVLWLLLLSS